MAFTTVQAGRGIAAISVALFHTEGVLSLDKYVGVEIFPAAAAMHFGVNFFFVLSGFIMATVHWDDIGKTNAIRAFVVRRILRIYPPLWVALVLSALLTVLVGQGPATLTDLALAITAFPVHVREPLLAIEWTLRHEVLFYGLCAVTIWRPKIGTIGIILWVLAPYVYAIPDHQSPISVVLSPYNSLFLFGVVAAVVCRYVALSKVLAVAAFSVGVALFIFSWFGELSLFRETYVWGTLLYGVGSTFALIGMVQAERLGMVKALPVLVWFGDASYSIYLVHFLAVSAAAKIFAPLATRGLLPNWLAFFAVAVVAIAFGALFYFIVELTILRVIKRSDLLMKMQKVGIVTLA